MLPRLKVIAGPDLDREYQLNASTGPVRFGRSKMHVDQHLNDPSVSRVHFQIEAQGPGVVVTDLNSSSGTCVNGRRIDRHELRSGDVIRAGETQLRYLPAGATDEATHEPAAEGDAPGRLEELAGQALAHFQVGVLLAKGASGCVFKARDNKTNQTVALKVLWPEFAQNEDEMQRFIRAMKTMLPLCHPNLVMLYGAGKAGALCWVSMEYVEGESLAQAIQRVGTDGKLDWKYGLRAAVHVSRALNYAGQQQIIHRNITPRNVLIRSGDGVALLGDLMLAKALEGSLAAQITKPGELVGDVSFMSPERTRGTGVDGRADLYSLGATVYAVLTGKPPFEGLSLVETLTKIRQAEPKKPRQYQPAIPEAFEAAVLKMLAKRPEDRPQTAAELLASLERLAKMNGAAV